MNIGIIGASGYAGGELIRLLQNHPEFNIEYLAAHSQAGEKVIFAHPHLTDYCDQVFSEISVEKLNELDLLFFSLPHGTSASLIKQVNPDKFIVDIGADFRLANPLSWKKYYGTEYAGKWVYGLVDLPGQIDKIKHTKQVANPGCYATAIELSAAPLVSNNLINQTDITVVAASGTTGAGRAVKSNLLAAESTNSLSSYKFGGVHQHTPEIEETLTSINNQNTKISFTPILAPMPRGILSTLSATLNKKIDISALRELILKFYENSSDVKLLPEGMMPQTNSVLGSNHVLLQVAIDEHTNRVLVSAAIDNLTKGAAGQAIQNANLISGFPINLGLNQIGLGR